MPQQIFLFLCQVVIRTVDRKVIFLALHDKVFQPFPHHLTFPANHGSLVDRQAFIGHHQILIDAQHLTESLTGRTCAQRIIKAKHHIGRLLEYHAIRLELLREFLHDSKDIPIEYTQKLILPERIRIESELLDMERKYGGRSFAYIGKCLHCSDNECTRNCGTPCRHPEKVRPSLEAFGFDIAKTLSELFNIELLWGKDGKLPEYLVLVSGFFHNEYELCNIAY